MECLMAQPSLIGQGWWSIVTRPSPLPRSRSPQDVNLEGGREGIEVARRLRRVCDAPIVFVTGYVDRDTVERIHEQVPGAPVLPKPVLLDHLADAVAEVIQPHH